MTYVPQHDDISWMGAKVVPITPSQAAAMKRCQSLTYVHVPKPQEAKS